ncbi:MAG: trypsin-like peptidase domain-containing protein [Moraxellaceae bacterium]
MKKSLFLLLLVFGTACHADVFQCTSSTGKTEFRDEPCDNKSSAKNLTSSVQVKSISSLDSIREGQSVCRPEFYTATGPYRAGTAFVLDYPTANAKALLVTAQHLFGPDGGMPQTISWQNMPSKVSRSECSTLSRNSRIIKTGSALAIPEAQSFASHGKNRDIAALPLKDTPPYAIKLARISPKTGDTIYLVAQLLGDARSGLMHKGTVTGNNAGLLEFSYEGGGISLNATSGAPIINEAGEVVGIHVGARGGLGKMTGLAVNLNQITSALSSAR